MDLSHTLAHPRTKRNPTFNRNNFTCVCGMVAAMFDICEYPHTSDFTWPSSYTPKNTLWPTSTFTFTNVDTYGCLQVSSRISAEKSTHPNSVN